MARQVRHDAAAWRPRYYCTPADHDPGPGWAAWPSVGPADPQPAEARLRLAPELRRSQILGRLPRGGLAARPPPGLREHHRQPASGNHHHPDLRLLVTAADPHGQDAGAEPRPTPPMPDGREGISTKPHQPVAFLLGRGAPIPAAMRGSRWLSLRAPEQPDLVNLCKLIRTVAMSRHGASLGFGRGSLMGAPIFLACLLS